MNISIFGLGYVGCVSMGCLSQFGHKIIGIDINETKIDLINSGKPTIIEKGLNRLISDGVRNGTVKATYDYVNAVLQTDVSIICVGTPSKKEGHLDLSGIYETARQIGEAFKNKKKFHTVLIRSTVFPGTNKKVGEIIEKESGKTRNTNFSVVSNPEFMREGSAVKDFMAPPFTVLATDSRKGFEICKSVYSGTYAPIERVSIEAAELIKYVNNSFHALKIAFANEVGEICKKMGINSHEVMTLFIKDKHLNISEAYLKPGFAYGGSCLPKDLLAFTTMAHDRYLEVPVLNSIGRSNKNHIEYLLKQILKMRIKKIGILGLSFKSGTDDLRNSPMVELVEQLLGKGLSVKIFDRNINNSRLLGANRAYIEDHLPHLSGLLVKNIDGIINGSELILINQSEKKFEKLISDHPGKKFIDLVHIIKGKKPDNYEGLCW